LTKFKVTNEKVLRRVNEDRQILNAIWQRKHRWTGQSLRQDVLLHEIIEGRMKGKRTRGRRRIPILPNEMMVATLYSNGQLRTERMETQRKDVKTEHK